MRWTDGATPFPASTTRRSRAAPKPVRRCSRRRRPPRPTEMPIDTPRRRVRSVGRKAMHGRRCCRRRWSCRCRSRQPRRCPPTRSRRSPRPSAVSPHPALLPSPPETRRLSFSVRSPSAIAAARPRVGRSFLEDNHDEKFPLQEHRRAGGRVGRARPGARDSPTTAPTSRRCVARCRSFDGVMPRSNSRSTCSKVRCSACTRRRERRRLNRPPPCHRRPPRHRRRPPRARSIRPLVRWRPRLHRRRPHDRRACSRERSARRRSGSSTSRSTPCSPSAARPSRDGEIEQLQGGGHDPQRRGFTLQQAELSFAGAVDPYFTAEAHVVFTPDVVELEEAYFTSTSLPANCSSRAATS